jgi:hypothetical protein
MKDDQKKSKDNEENPALESEACVQIEPTRTAVLPDAQNCLIHKQMASFCLYRITINWKIVCKSKHQLGIQSHNLRI